MGTSSTMFLSLYTLLSIPLLVEATLQDRVCLNNSYYDPVEYTPGEECCTTMTTDPICTTIRKEVCINVTSQVCRCQVFAEYRATDCPVTLAEISFTDHFFMTTKCEEVPVSVPHTEIRLVPKNVTKKMCKTFWKVNENGEKEPVVDKTDCEDVPWEEYVEEPYVAVTETTETVCRPGEEIHYRKCSQTEHVVKQLCYRYEVVARPVCEPVVREDCGFIEIQTCEPQVSEPRNCIRADRVPSQMFQHREKCLGKEVASITGSNSTATKEPLDTTVTTSTTTSSTTAITTTSTTTITTSSTITTITSKTTTTTNATTTTSTTTTNVIHSSSATNTPTPTTTTSLSTAPTTTTRRPACQGSPDCCKLSGGDCGKKEGPCWGDSECKSPLVCSAVCWDWEGWPTTYPCCDDLYWA